MNEVVHHADDGPCNDPVDTDSIASRDYRSIMAFVVIASGFLDVTILAQAVSGWVYERQFVAVVSLVPVPAMLLIMYAVFCTRRRLTRDSDTGALRCSSTVLGVPVWTDRNWVPAGEARTIHVVTTAPCDGLRHQSVWIELAGGTWRSVTAGLVAERAGSSAPVACTEQLHRILGVPIVVTDDPAEQYRFRPSPELAAMAYSHGVPLLADDADAPTTTLEQTTDQPKDEGCPTAPGTSRSRRVHPRTSFAVTCWQASSTAVFLLHVLAAGCGSLSKSLLSPSPLVGAACAIGLVHLILQHLPVQRSFVFFPATGAVDIVSYGADGTAIDVVPADFDADAIAAVHLRKRPDASILHYVPVLNVEIELVLRSGHRKRVCNPTIVQGQFAGLELLAERLARFGATTVNVSTDKVAST